MANSFLLRVAVRVWSFSVEKLRFLAFAVPTIHFRRRDILWSSFANMPTCVFAPIRLVPYSAFAITWQWLSIHISISMVSFTLTLLLSRQVIAKELVRCFR